MKTFLIFGLLLVVVMPTTALAQAPPSKEGTGMDAVIPEDGNIGAAAFGSLSSQSADDAAGSSVLLAIVLVQGMALAFLLWKILSRSQGQGATLRRAFACPFRGREVIAEFQLDVAERPIDVAWCTAFCPAVLVECGKQCLRMQPVRQGVRREPSGEFGVLHAAGKRLRTFARGPR